MLRKLQKMSRGGGLTLDADLQGGSGETAYTWGALCCFRVSTLRLSFSSEICVAIPADPALALNPVLSPDPGLASVILEAHFGRLRLGGRGGSYAKIKN